MGNEIVCYFFSISLFFHLLSMQQITISIITNIIYQKCKKCKYTLSRLYFFISWGPQPGLHTGATWEGLHCSSQATHLGRCPWTAEPRDHCIIASAVFYPTLKWLTSVISRQIVSFLFLSPKQRLSTALGLQLIG